jgi:FMN reductase [NAD(P)H]
MNAVLSVLEDHRSDRAFTDEPVSDAVLDAIIRAGHRAPTSCNGQHVSVVTVRDNEKRARIAELAGKQPWVAKAPVFLTVVLDLYKLNAGVTRAGRVQSVQNHVEGLITGCLDCGIALQAMAVAARSQGLGIVPIGGIRNNPQEIIDLLALPPLTFAPVGLSVGHVAKQAGQRPRLPLSTFRHDEAYDLSRIVEAVDAYDAAMLAFWKEQGRPDGKSWSAAIAPRFDHNERPKLRPTLTRQGMKFED